MAKYSLFSVPASSRAKICCSACLTTWQRRRRRTARESAHTLTATKCAAERAQRPGRPPCRLHGACCVSRAPLRGCAAAAPRRARLQHHRLEVVVPISAHAQVQLLRRRARLERLGHALRKRARATAQRAPVSAAATCRNRGQGSSSRRAARRAPRTKMGSGGACGTSLKMVAAIARAPEGARAMPNPPRGRLSTLEAPRGVRRSAVLHSICARCGCGCVTRARCNGERRQRREAAEVAAKHVAACAVQSATRVPAALRRQRPASASFAPALPAAATPRAHSRRQPLSGARRLGGGMSDAGGGAAPASPPACFLICHNVSKKHNSASAGSLWLCAALLACRLYG